MCLQEEVALDKMIGYGKYEFRRSVNVSWPLCSCETCQSASLPMGVGGKHERTWDIVVLCWLA